MTQQLYDHTPQSSGSTSIRVGRWRADCAVRVVSGVVVVVLSHEVVLILLDRVHCEEVELIPQ
jgi:hypothetical protein